MSLFGFRTSLVFGLLFAIAAQTQAQAQWRPFGDGFSDSSSSPRKRAGRTDKVPPPISQYVLISSSTDQATGRAIARYQKLVAAGGWARIPSGPSLKFGSSDKRVIALRRRLQMTGELSQGGKLSQGFDRGVHDAVIRFQTRHGLTPSGKVNRFTLKALNVPARQRLNQLKLNRQRLRKLLAKTKGKTYILVNIPGYELQAVSKGQLQITSRVVSGKPATRTPEVTTAVRAVNFLPYWHVPQSIAHRALIPAVKKDPGYLAREHIRVYASWGGAEVDPTQVNWHAPQGKRYVFRQDPGPFNALGVIRLDMPNRHIVYMHDTPLKKLFNYHLRPYSAGCVRVEQVQQLAAWLLQKEGGWSQGRISQTIQSGQAKTVKLKRSVPVHFTYLSAWGTSDGVANFRIDIYDKDAIKARGAKLSKWETGSRSVAP
jgi:murein L,D-transpeptidase YcbB/YkuD